MVLILIETQRAQSKTHSPGGTASFRMEGIMGPRPGIGFSQTVSYPFLGIVKFVNTNIIVMHVYKIIRPFRISMVLIVIETGEEPAGKTKPEY